MMLHLLLKPISACCHMKACTFCVKSPSLKIMSQRMFGCNAAMWHTGATVMWCKMCFMSFYPLNNLFINPVFFPVAGLRPMSSRTCWITCKVVARSSSRCSPVNHRPGVLIPRHPPPLLCHLPPLSTNRPSSLTFCRWKKAAARPPSTDPSLPSAPQVRLQHSVCVWLNCTIPTSWTC